MRKCKCGNDVARNAKACPKCGHRFTGGFTKFLAWCFGIFMGLVVLIAVFGSILSNSTTADKASSQSPSANTSTPVASAPLTTPVPAKAEDKPTEARARAQTSSRQTSARQDYTRQLEQHLLSQGLDAHVTAVGQQKDTLRISWAGMSRPVVYNMINSSGMQLQVPSLGFKKVIMTDDGSFSGTEVETWTYRWDGQQWRQ